MDNSGKLHVVEVGETEVQAPGQPKEAPNPPPKETATKPAPTVEKEGPEIPGAEQPTDPHSVPAPDSSPEPTAKPS